MHTDLPEPVEPAISICGISLRFATMASPEMSLPTAKEILDLAFLKFSESMISLNATGVDFSFSISTPIAAFPGIGASIRMLFALKLRAISSARFTILDTLTPTAGWISYLVTVGPWVT